ncbi:hypothetical protein [Microvirga sesbaniae]|uniref:hypothetical protein n=1 Tax=Microvirga sesbaniae TaxID=681392 RepID=UPI0021C56CC8|nr:hypothetical protein [Microvirga sp. HBU67692]
MMRTCFVALMLITSGSSWAGWQNTQWGMTFDEVIASGQGRITPHSEEQGPNNNLVLKAKMPYIGYGIEFTALFYFNDDKLGQIVLRPNNMGDNFVIDRIMKETYGIPVSEENKSLLVCRMKILTWRDEKSYNTVRYTEANCPPNATHASVTYQPLREPGKSGL